MKGTPMDLLQLALDLDGHLYTPSHPSWDTARQAWNLAVDQQPDAVVVAASARDVQAVVRFATGAGLRVAPQATGHNAAPLGLLAGTILLRLSELRSVSIDPTARRARVEGGAQWGDVTPAAAKFGLAALAGSAADVGVAGYTLGGGISWLGRSHGLAANSVTALEVVTADGELRRIDAEHEPELFWALRGGGGSFAVVTALEFELFPITHVTAGTLFFPLGRADEVLRTWASWTRDVPDAVTTVGRLLRFPPVPDLPPFLSGQSYAVVEVCSTLDADATADLIAPLRALGPQIDSVAVIPIEELAQLHMDPPAPVPAAGDGFLLAEAGDDVIDAIIRVAGPGVDSPLLSVELRHAGGALAPGRGAGGAVDGLAAEYVGFAVGFAPVPEAGVAVMAAVQAVQHAVAPWLASRVYPNFAETHKHGDALFGKETHARLRAVKGTYDPDDVIRANHPIRPQGSSSIASHEQPQ